MGVCLNGPQNPLLCRCAASSDFPKPGDRSNGPEHTNFKTGLIGLVPATPTIVERRSANRVVGHQPMMKDVRHVRDRVRC